MDSVLNILKNIFKTTRAHKAWWETRQIDWQQAYFNVDHPHRGVLVNLLKQINFKSVLEIGCASGANLWRISQAFPGREIGGVDINENAIAQAKKNLPRASLLEVSSADHIFLSDKSTDLTISDMCLIYVGPRYIRRVIGEIKRVTRNHVLFLEFHSESPLKRLLLRLGAGYYAYNWTKLLESEGFYDIVVQKLPPESWPGGAPQDEFAYFIYGKI